MSTPRGVAGEAIVDPSVEPEQRGILAIQHLRFLAQEGVIRTEAGLLEDQWQPNSIDLRLGAVAHRVRCSFLPGALGVDACLADLGCHMHALDLSQGLVIEPNVPYLIELQESLALPAQLTARALGSSSVRRARPRSGSE